MYPKFAEAPGPRVLAQEGRVQMELALGGLMFQKFPLGEPEAEKLKHRSWTLAAVRVGLLFCTLQLYWA